MKTALQSYLWEHISPFLRISTWLGLGVPEVSRQNPAKTPKVDDLVSAPSERRQERGVRAFREILLKPSISWEPSVQSSRPVPLRARDMRMIKAVHRDNHTMFSSCRSGVPHNAQHTRTCCASQPPMKLATPEIKDAKGLSKFSTPSSSCFKVDWQQTSG